MKIYRRVISLQNWFKFWNITITAYIQFLPRKTITFVNMIKHSAFFYYQNHFYIEINLIENYCLHSRWIASLFLWKELRWYIRKYDNGIVYINATVTDIAIID